MKKYIVEDKEEGFLKLIGERITIFCNSYIYCGKLIGVNDTCVLLEKAEIVYETGGFDSKEWENAQKLPHNWYVQMSAVESFGILK